MKDWFRLVTNDLVHLPDAIEYYEKEQRTAKAELSMKNQPIERHEAELPSIVEKRFGQLQEIEAILEHLNIHLRKLKTKHFRKYLESYNRQLSSRDAEKFSEGEPEIVDMMIVINEFALIRNKFLGVIKALEHKGFMLGHITKLRISGLDDAQIM